MVNDYCLVLQRIWAWNGVTTLLVTDPVVLGQLSSLEIFLLLEKALGCAWVAQGAFSGLTVSVVHRGGRLGSDEDGERLGEWLEQMCLKSSVWWS